MRTKRYKLFRGLAVVTAFLCALFIGLEMVASISDYKVLINDIFGGSSSGGGNAEAYAYVSEFDTTVEMMTERQRVAEQISEEGCVLLRNDEITDGVTALPLTAEEKKVTVLGSRAYTYKTNGDLRTPEESGGGNSNSLSFYGGIVGSVVNAQTVTTDKGTFSLPITLETALKGEGIEINPALVSAYSSKPYPALVKGSEANGSEGGAFSVKEPAITLAECGNYSEYSDACFVVVGRASGEGREYLPGSAGVEDKSDGSKSALNLSDGERALITLAKQISDKVIVLINSAVAMEIDELKTNTDVDAVLWIGLPGLYGLNGVARVISGAASPSGKLSDTYAVDASASPAARNFGVNAVDGSGRFTWSNGGSQYSMADNGHYVVLAEGLYTGYYYYETRYADCVEGNGNAASSVGRGYGATGDNWKYEDEVSYSFGYGLSYETFEQKIVEDSLEIDYENKTISIDVWVKNTGDKTAKSVIQLYVQTPYTDYDRQNGVEKSAIQLIDFEKVELEGGAEDTVTLTFRTKYLASYDKTASHDGVTGGYILENGNYYFGIGNGAHEALNNVLAKKGVDESLLYIEEGSAVNADGAVEWTFEADKMHFDTNGVDAQTLGKSNDTTIKNQMSDADYNYYNDVTVKYLSRNDWENTFPKSYVNLALNDDLKFQLDSRIYKFGTGSSNVEFGVDHTEEEDEEGNSAKNLMIADMKLASYDDERWDYLVEQITFDEAWALSPYGGTSCNAFLSVAAPEVWQIDGPNGNVTRPISSKAASTGPMAVAANDPNGGYKACDMCCEPMTAATFNKELLKRQGEMYGEDMLWSRNTIIWAPGMNLHRTPFNSRNHEYYSEDPILTNYLGASFIEGGTSKGAILAAKHFAFNTQESYREGLCQFMEEQSARELELRAFECLGDGVHYVNAQGNEIGALGIMTSFSRVGAYGVNAHTGVMKNILRKEWGFKGLSSTDMVVGGRFFNPQDSVINNVTFMATSNADNLLSNFWPDYNNKNKVKNDPAMLEALSENMHYYMYAIANSSALNGYDGDTVIGEQIYGWQYAIKAAYWIMLVATIALAGTAVYFVIKDKKSVETDDVEAEPDTLDDVDFSDDGGEV